jgi:hypothetical protein
MLYTKLCDLLDLALKSDEIIEVLEHFDLSVVYDFDRLNEGTEDIYWASAKQSGFELKFNARQVLEVVFLYAEPQGEFGRADSILAGIPFYQSYDEAKTALLAQHATIKEGSNKSWVKGEFSDHSAHYEFSPLGTLRLVTLTSNYRGTTE